MSRLLCGLMMSWLVLGSPAAVRADDAEDKAVAFVKGIGGSVVRDEKLPGKPVVGVSLSGTLVTAAELKELAPLTNLTTLNLTFTKVMNAGGCRTPAGVAEVQDQMELTPKGTRDRASGEPAGRGLSEEGVL